MNYNGSDSLFMNSWINLKNEGKLKTLTESEVLTSSLRACSYGSRGARKDAGLHMQPWGVGVRLKMLSRGR